MQSTVLRAGAFVLFAISVTACGPSSTVPYQQPTNSSITSSTSGTTTLPSLTTAGFTVTGSIGPTSVAATIAEKLSLSAPSDITVPLAQRRVASHTQSGTPVGTANLLLYVTFSSSTDVTMTTSPALTFASSAIASGTMYNLALYANGAWTAPYQPGVTATTAGTVSFPSTSTSVSITPTAPATFVLYTGDATTSAIVLLPTSLSFDAGNPSSGSFGASEVGYAGALSATMTCTENPTGQTPGSNAFVAEFTGGGTTASETPSAAGASVTFNVSSGAETGSCSVVISDTNNNSSTETIDVSATSLTVTGKQRN